MRLPSNSYKETVSPERTLLFARANSRKGKHAQIPENILARLDVSPAAKVVLGTMRMKSMNCGGLVASMAALGKAAGLSRTYVFECLLELESKGLIRKVGRRVKQVQPFEIICDARATSEITSEVQTARRVRQLTPCVLCKDPCVPQKRTGWCRKCSADARNRVITKALVREEVGAALGRRETA